jgi:hypothetical protein
MLNFENIGNRKNKKNLEENKIGFIALDHHFNHDTL